MSTLLAELQSQLRYVKVCSADSWILSAEAFPVLWTDRALPAVWCAAVQRGVYQRAVDPSGHHLVVPAAQAMRETYPHLEGDTGGDKPSLADYGAAGGGDAGSLRGSYGSSNSAARRPLGSRKVAAAKGGGSRMGVAAGGEEGVVAAGVEGGDGVLVL
jgi:hypothetical protein